MKFTIATALAAFASIALAQQGSPQGYASQNGGTTGGKGGQTVTVTDLAGLNAALGKKTDTTAKIIRISGIIKGAAKVYVGSNKSIIGADSNSGLEGIGMQIGKSKNVIVQNLKISKVIASNGDGIGIQESTNVWVDHVDISNDLDHDKDYYDGMLDVTHAADFVTVSNSYFHDHFKGSLVGHSDSNGAEDTGHLRVSYINNYWKNVGSRTPSVRFGTAHIINNVYEGIFTTGIDTRQNAQVLVESTVFTGTAKPLGSYNGDVTGFAVVKDVNFGTGTNTAPRGTLQSAPYSVAALGSANVRSAVVGKAGNTLKL
ncbi:Pectate lyase-like protein 3 [Elsinoe fawcettii]|nr:Pectate lyase-like protein 3 [Elsinoe fawcettii]